jgi:homoaconitase/3-isopropylmalate dehydratase large subunit
VFVGSCNNSDFEDVAAFARLVEGETVASGTDLIVIPGSRQALFRLNEEGLTNAIIEAGGMIGTPGCGPCFGAHGGILGEGDVCLGTMNRNFPGRMGPGEIYLGSPETVAAAAIYGEITDPREVR